MFDFGERVVVTGVPPKKGVAEQVGYTGAKSLDMFQRSLG